MIELGQTVGNYKVISKLGEGAMGAVFLAEHPVIGRKAALKVIHPQHGRNPEVVARFVNEATAINRIGHQHIVEVTDFGRTPAGDFYFIMEYLEGQILSDLIVREAPFAPARALAIAAQIADALFASHSHGVIHRDLKPDNIFLISREDDDAFVKVLDFGLAKLLNDDGAACHETRRGVVMGTPYYMSPEQCEGREEIDARTDVYALGVVLFEMLTGHLPFGGDSYGEVLMKQITVRAPAARSLVPELPEALDAVLARALAKEPGDRFANMEELRAALLEPVRAAPARVRPLTHDDLARQVRAAQPMSRAEIARRRTLIQTSPSTQAPPSTLGAGAVHLDDDPTLDRVPRRTGPRTVAFVMMAAAGGMALAAGLTYGRAVQATAAPAVAPAPPPPRTVALTFSSDPSGASVIAPDGTTVGTTPLSIQVPRSDRPQAYRFEKPGFEAKEMESIPNVPSAMFALMQPQTRRLEPQAAADPAPAHRPHPRSGARTRGHLDDDGVLEPSFDK